MNRSTYRFTLDLQKHRSQMSIAVFVHDSAVRLIISLTDGGIPYHIESGGRAVFYGKRPDDTPLCHNCMIDDTGRIIYDFNDQTASVEGITDCQIRIYGRSRELVSAPRFIIVADERPVNDADIEKQEDSPLAALDKIQFAEIERVDAETARAEAETARSDAEAVRITNELARIDAEAVRIKNENERIDAEAERIKNEEARIEAETAQNQKISELEGNITDNERRLTEIEEHLAPKYIITDDKTAYRKDVPANACSKAQLNSIGGMTYVDEATNTFVDAKVTELKAHGANLIPFPYHSNFTQNNGVTITVNEDSSITFEGTATGNIYYYMAKQNYFIPFGTYTLCAGTTAGQEARVHLETYKGGVYQQGIYVYDNSASENISKDYDELRLFIHIKPGQTISKTFRPTLNKGTTAFPYEPFKEAETIFQIPPEIQALPNYGKMFTKLDLVNKKFIDEYADMDGVVSWDENPVRVFEIQGDDGATVLGYDCSVQFMREDAPVWDIGNIGLVITEKSYDSIEYVGTQFILHKRVAQLDWWGSGYGNDALVEELFGKVTIVAKSLMMVQEDISAHIDNNIIKVTAGGAIEFVNNDKKAVPSSVSFMMGGHLLEKEV